MPFSLSLSSPVLPRARLALVWAIIGFILLSASIAQTIVSSQLRDMSAEEMLAPLQGYTGGQPLPDQVRDLFAGMFANIEFSLAFAAVKAALGVLILFSVHHLRAGKDWPARILAVIAALGIAAFIGIGGFFVYSAIVMSGAMAMPIVVLAFMSLTGIAFAAVPAILLWRHFRSFSALATGAPQPA